MRLAFEAVVRDMKRGGLLVIVVGQPNDHLMDWRGCNYHRLNLPGWPSGKRMPDDERGLAVCKALIRSLNDKKLRAAIEWKRGQFFGDYDRRFKLV